MNKVVRHEHVSAAILPESLRGEISPDAVVTVTVTEEGGDEIAAERRRAAFRRFRGAAADRGTSTEDAVDRIRVLRDEWDRS